MSWFKVDDGLHSHSKTHRAGNEAIGLWTVAGSWCADKLTDGEVPVDTALRFGSAKVWAKLVSAGFVEEKYDTAETKPRLVAYVLHDYLDYNPTAAEVLKTRAERSEAKARAGKLGGIASGVAKRTAAADSKREAEAKQRPKQTIKQPEASASIPVPAPDSIPGSRREHQRPDGALRSSLGVEDEPHPAAGLPDPRHQFQEPPGEVAAADPADEVLAAVEAALWRPEAFRRAAADCRNGDRAAVRNLAAEVADGVRAGEHTLAQALAGIADAGNSMEKAARKAKGGGVKWARIQTVVPKFVEEAYTPPPFVPGPPTPARVPSDDEPPF